ncbi:MAG: BolA family protein [Marinicella sp.]|nr:BolA family transcriptional regulator [Xanthomonadales bacterium]
MSQHHQTKKNIENILKNWGASQVFVTDNSHLHAGHEGAKSGGGHFAVTVFSDVFAGLSRIQCHRLVYQQLTTLFTSGAIHALEVEAKTQR